jgi:hypothetical protein
VLRVLSPAKIITLETDPQLNLQLCQVADSLFNTSYNTHFLNDCRVLLAFIENAPHYDRATFTKQLVQD